MPSTSNPPALTVELHDISPATWPEARRILSVLDDLGIGAPTLLVVPMHQLVVPMHQLVVPMHQLVVPMHQVGARAPVELGDCPGLVDMLHERVRAGAEIVQHGLTHLAPLPPPRGARNLLMHRYFGRGQAEFAHLDRAEAARRLAKGRGILSACGLRAEGFIAPAWQQSPGAIQAVRDEGFAFTAFLGKVVPLVGSGRAVVAPALTFCAQGPLVDHPKRLVMRGVEALSRRAPLLRLALHPEDARAPGRLAHITARLKALTRERRVLGYARWLSEGGCLFSSAPDKEADRIPILEEGARA